MTHTLSIVIPAHDEANVITTLLSGILADPRSSEIEIIVVANGCTDDTAVRAGTFPDVTVSSITQSSKIAALREGDRLATCFPRAYVDADVQVSTDTLLALATELRTAGGPLVAAPTLVVDTSSASWPTRQFYKVWELTDYRQHDHIGSGIYALSAEGRARFGDWPAVTADDRFIQQLFDPSERRSLTNHSFTVQSPRSLHAQINRATRIIRGNRELPNNLQKAAQPRATRHLALAGRVIRRPRLWLAAAIYVAATGAAALRAAREMRRGGQPEWHRDHTTRTAHGK